MTLDMASWKPLLISFANHFNYFVAIYFVSVNTIYILMLIFAFWAIQIHMRELKLVELNRIFKSPFFKPISIIVPAHNEQAGIVESVKSLLQLHYPLFEVIVVNDGSTDRTFDELAESFSLYMTDKVYRKQLPCQEVLGLYASRIHSNLLVVDKKNGGKKADATNAGINASQYPLICAIDADSLLEPDVLLRIIRPFLEDPLTVAAGGTIRISNGCTVKNGYVTHIGLPKSMLGKFQILEYLRAFLVGRVAFSALDSLLIISGAFGIFKKDPVIKAGGFNTATVGEDMELVVRLHKYLNQKKEPYKMVYIPEPVCWTEAPETLSVLGKQRKRWQRGLLECLFGNFSMMLNPRYGWIGLFAFPFFLIAEGIGCLIEVSGIFVFAVSWHYGIVNRELAFLFTLGAVVLNIFLSLGAILFEELSYRRYPKITDILSLFWLSFIETFFYRPLSTLWRFTGTMNYIFNTKSEWGEMQKQGFKIKT